MTTLLRQLIEHPSIDIVSPFQLSLSHGFESFTCLIRGYGAAQGMLIDSDGHKFATYGTEIATLGYGYSCFNIEAEDSVQEFIDEVLNGDWGKVGENHSPT
ncbi:hypothetical protein ACE02H_01385 [Shewanella mangrovisoli]|uniref:hypothetical protein n=1 Tax=Shewanella mangrovisoli TaxID=2864211 RepID=UPI0035B6C7AD